MKTETKEQRVYELAVQFRDAVQNAGFTYPDFPTLADFPNGSCGDASLLLGEFLYESGEGEWEYVAGMRSGDTQSHAWIEQDGLLVDITADQFGDQPQVLVTKDKSWHKQFSREVTRQPARGGVYANTPHIDVMLRKAYERIKQFLK